MAIDPARRRWVQRSAALFGAMMLPVEFAVARAGVQGRPAASRSEWPALLASWQRRGTYYAGLWRVGESVSGIALPSRAHGLALDPRDANRAIVVARRPGDWLMRFSVRGELEPLIASTDENRVFNGHAAFSANGDTLYTSENDVDDGSGVIGVRDPATLEKRAELATHGIGPHELLVELDGTLLVANGGILTVPEMGRAKLNLGAMDPSLVRIDARDGRLLEQWRLPDARLSIRHLARAPDGGVGIALQAEHPTREERERAPLLAIFDGASLQLAAAPPDADLRGYGGDVACIVANGATRFAVSCPRAGRIAWWDSAGPWRGSAPLRDACALAPCGEALIAVGEGGDFARLAVRGDELRAAAPAGIKWDNHAVALLRV